MRLPFRLLSLSCAMATVVALQLENVLGGQANVNPVLSRLVVVNSLSVTVGSCKSDSRPPKFPAWRVLRVAALAFPA